VLLAEELALLLIAQAPRREDFSPGPYADLCLAGLLVGELLLAGVVGPATHEDRVVVLADATLPTAPTLLATAQVVIDEGPKLVDVLTYMKPGLEHYLSRSTWEETVSLLKSAGIVGPGAGRRGRKLGVQNVAALDGVVGRLRAAAHGDGPIEARTALLLSIVGPAFLLKTVAPERGTRPHARRRVDEALNGSRLQALGEAVRQAIADDAKRTFDAID